MKKKIIVVTVILFVLVAGVTLTVKATGSIYDYFTKTAEIGQFADDWDFYYKNEDGEMIELNHFGNGGTMEPIVYNGIIYLRSGFLLEELGFGGTLDRDNRVMTLYHPNYSNEGETEVHYNNEVTEQTDEEKKAKEEESKKAEEKLSQDDLFVIVEDMDRVHALMLEVNNQLFDFMYYKDSKSDIANTLSKAKQESDKLYLYEEHPLVKLFLEDYVALVELANRTIEEENEDLMHEYSKKVYPMGQHIYEMSVRASQ